jgi:hypothetical protein
MHPTHDHPSGASAPLATAPSSRSLTPTTTPLPVSTGLPPLPPPGPLQQRVLWLLLSAPLLEHVDPGRLAFLIACGLVALAIERGLAPVPAPS